ncbi:hypothetical protein BLA29_003476 [Euroglyphus maynei]|uniref:KASH domain-containing protein n=1 Tax=Euroglyphus maynei TaxID=6958 RepID=A0A1Y3BFA5_EURMA|nr:hypothetical protein BLA29_003476 [Euroglyphus maynei]
METFDDKKKDLVDDVELSNEPRENSFSDIWLDYLSPLKLNSEPDNNNENDLKSKEIEKNDKSNEPSFGENIEQIKLTLSSSDDWLDYLSPQVSNDMKFNHDHVNPNIVPSNEITTRPIIMMTESMKNQKSRSKKKSKKHKRNQLSIITDTTDNNEKVAVNHIEPKSSSDSDVLPNQKSFHIHDSSDDWLDYLSVIIVEENKNEKFDLQRSIIDLQPIENDVDRKSHGESVLTISKEMENSLNRIYENNNNNNNGDNRNENNGQQQVEITMKPMSSKNEQNEKIDNDANENEKSQLGPINNVDFRMQVVVDNGDDGNHLKNGIQTLPLSKFSEEIENNNNSNERSFDKEKRRPALGVVDFNKEKDKQRKNQTNAGMNFIENKHAFINDDGKDYSFEINNTVQPSSSKDVKSLNVNDIDDDEKSNVRNEEIENPKSSMKRFKRILLNSLPFYLLFLLIFLLFLMLPKDENEFNCLLRNDYYNNEMTLKKMYLHGAPPI